MDREIGAPPNNDPPNGMELPPRALLTQVMCPPAGVAVGSDMLTQALYPPVSDCRLVIRDETSFF